MAFTDREYKKTDLGKEYEFNWTENSRIKS